MVTAAVRFTVAFVWICAGNDGMKPIERTVGALIAIGCNGFIALVMLTLGSATDVAVIVTKFPETATVVPAGVTGGAV